MHSASQAALSASEASVASEACILLATVEAVAESGTAAEAAAGKHHSLDRKAD